jgi:tRNA modification GTPase
MPDTKYDLNDTITAVSSPTSDKRVIVRVTGPETIDVLSQIFVPPPQNHAATFPGTVVVDDQLKVDAKLYLFLAPHSYTGENLAEIHIHTNPAVTQALIDRLLDKGLRPAGPGEFTARAYLNGKIDLSQAEAVNEIVTGSNRFHLAAAEKLLAGRLGKTTAKIQDQIMDCLSLIEAGLDFSTEDIEFITRDQAAQRLRRIKQQLEKLLSGNISYESVIESPAVGIAGAPNAGKSSLLNKILGKPRSIVSPSPKTTRDVLTGLLTLTHSACVLFDCAGLIREPSNILEQLAQTAAIEGLKNASVVVFCVDLSKDDFAEDKAVRGLLKAKALIPVATRCDLLSENVLPERLARLKRLFAGEFIATSAKTGTGIERLKAKIDSKIIALGMAAPKTNISREPPEAGCQLALTTRHKHAVAGAIDDITDSLAQLTGGSDEVAAMLLRDAYQQLSTIQAHHIDEKILEKIFSRFCIGK